jgi:hypothetical protein
MPISSCRNHADVRASKVRWVHLRESHFVCAITVAQLTK